MWMILSTDKALCSGLHVHALTTQTQVKHTTMKRNMRALSSYYFKATVAGLPICGWGLGMWAREEGKNDVDVTNDNLGRQRGIDVDSMSKPPIQIHGSWRSYICTLETAFTWLFRWPTQTMTPFKDPVLSWHFLCFLECVCPQANSCLSGVKTVSTCASVGGVCWHNEQKCAATTK